MAVDPNDEDVAIVGAIDLFRTTDAGANWTQISVWAHFNNGTCNTLSLPIVHADQHAIVFKSSTEVVFGHDGGIDYTTDVTVARPETGKAAVVPTFVNRNNDYNVTQFYSGALHPDTGSDVILGGTQDNGTQRFDAPNIDATDRVKGGDGGFSFIDQTQATIAIASFTKNNYSRSSDGGQTFPTTLISDNNTGRFINPADYDDREDILFTARDANSIYRVSSVAGTPSSPATVSVSLGVTASHIRVSPFATAGTSTLFIGTSAGRVFSVTNAHGSSPTLTDITGSSFPVGNVSCIEIGADEDQLLVTFSNYGVTSVWESLDGGTTWTNKEGDLPDMPVRWALYNPNNRQEVLLATEAGVWETTDISAASPTWTAAATVPTVRVDMLQYRSSDNVVIASTHGRGVWTAQFASPGVDVALVLDRSGSMGSFGFMEPAKTAASTFVGLTQIGDKVAVASFNSSATVNFPLTTILSNDTKTAAQDAIAAIFSSGRTSIGAGMEAGQGELNKSNTGLKQGMVLLSDGFENEPPFVADVLPTIPENTDIYTIALGANSDQQLLNNIAAQTGGFFSFAPDASGLQGIYNAIRANVTGQQVIATSSGTVNQGQTTAETATVDGSVSNATFSVTWPGSDIDLELTDPTGNVIDPSVAATDPDIDFTSGSTYEFYTINAPASGQWTLTITGVDLPTGSEPYTASVVGSATLTLEVFFDQNQYEVGEPILISTELDEEGTPITGATVAADILTPTSASAQVLRDMRAAGNQGTMKYLT